ncbi:SEC-C domain-containing protein [Inquilinus sp. OTU3971]|uniref:SEC-C domain-containing protein n=1 Tax=Inquilinus sp. OTU3971 TaxID=3043855 RepID=UPI00406D01F7
MLANGQVQLVSPRVYPLPINQLEDGMFESRFSGKLQKIARPGGYSSGSCYWNVEKHVNQHGGSKVNGWLLNWWPRLYTEAMHHAVWKSPSGELIDVTNDPYGSNEHGHSTFSEDESIPINLEFWPCIPSDWCYLQHDLRNLTYAFIHSCHARSVIARLYSQFVLQNGLKLDENGRYPGKPARNLTEKRLLEAIEAITLSIGGQINELKRLDVVRAPDDVTEQCPCGSGLAYKKCHGVASS